MEPDLRRFTTRQVNFVREDGLSEIVLEVKDFSKYLMIGRTLELGQGKDVSQTIGIFKSFFSHIHPARKTWKCIFIHKSTKLLSNKLC